MEMGNHTSFRDTGHMKPTSQSANLYISVQAGSGLVTFYYYMGRTSSHRPNALSIQRIK